MIFFSSSSGLDFLKFQILILKLFPSMAKISLHIHYFRISYKQKYEPNLKFVITFCWEEICCLNVLILVFSVLLFYRLWMINYFHSFEIGLLILCKIHKIFISICIFCDYLAVKLLKDRSILKQTIIEFEHKLKHRSLKV